MLSHVPPDPQLISNIRSSQQLVPNIRNLSEDAPSSPSSGRSVNSHRSLSRSYAETETGDGQNEIQLLARRILEYVDGDPDEIDHMISGSVQAGSSVATSHSGMRDHDELARSVRQALGPGSHR